MAERPDIVRHVPEPPRRGGLIPTRHDRDLSRVTLGATLRKHELEAEAALDWHQLKLDERFAIEGIEAVQDVAEAAQAVAGNPYAGPEAQRIFKAFCRGVAYTVERRANRR